MATDGSSSRPDRAARAVVTGMGIVSPLGQSLPAFWDALVAPTDTAVPTSMAHFDPAAYMSRSEINRTSEGVEYAVAAAALAVDDAGAPDCSGLRAGVMVGNTHGAMLRIEQETQRYHELGPKAISGFVAVLANDNAPAAGIAQRLGSRGPCEMVGAACASGTYSVALGARLVATGECDVVVAGGTAAPLPAALLAAYDNLRVLAADGFVRPFDQRRDGFVYTTGAAMLVIERLDRALDRGARIYGEVLGSARTNDAFHPIRQSGEGAIECMRLAIADAGLEPAAIAHVNAHGSATTANDATEAAAARAVFGDAAGTAPSITSIKRATGHSLGAAGSFEAVSVLLSFEHGLLPPAGIDFQPDASLGVDVVTGAPRPWEPGPTVSNSFGLGGQNGAIVLSPVEH